MPLLVQRDLGLRSSSSYLENDPKTREEIKITSNTPRIDLEVQHTRKTKPGLPR